jgi:glycerophosphoryl diester phosphodiesterase
MYRTAWLMILLIFLFSCRKEEFQIVNLNGNKIIALGHGGMGVGWLYALNSQESILKCLNLGMDGSEFDVQMTKDSVLVAYHGLDLSDATSLKGRINSLDWADIKEAYYNEIPYFQNSIISLEQLFSNIDNIHKYKYTFDCKLNSEGNDINKFYETFINAVVKILQKYNIEENVYIESQNYDFLNLFKNKKPNYKLFIYPSSFDAGLNIALTLQLYGITISTRDITKEQIKIAHNNGLFVAIWNTHNAKENMAAIKKSPDFIQTDKVKNILKLLK